MELLNAAKTKKKERPIKVLQFGEGNFLRAFVDYFICLLYTSPSPRDCS